MKGELKLIIPQCTPSELPLFNNFIAKKRGTITFLIALHF